MNLRYTRWLSSARDQRRRPVSRVLGITHGDLVNRIRKVSFRGQFIVSTRNGDGDSRADRTRTRREITTFRDLNRSQDCETRESLASISPIAEDRRSLSSRLSAHVSDESWPIPATWSSPRASICAPLVLFVLLISARRDPSHPIFLERTPCYPSLVDFRWMRLSFKPDPVSPTVTNETSYNCQRGGSTLGTRKLPFFGTAREYLDLIPFARKLCLPPRNFREPTLARIRGGNFV